MSGEVWEVWGAYHERERLCPEGVRVREIAHVHYVYQWPTLPVRACPAPLGPVSRKCAIWVCVTKRCHLRCRERPTHVQRVKATYRL